MSLSIKVPKNLPALVKARFDQAKASGDLLFWPTNVSMLFHNAIPFQLRYAPALSAKPRNPDPEAPSRPPINPFACPHPSLVVAQLPPSHVILLNKFAIVPEHFLLVTREFAPQTYLLEPADLAAAYACVEAYRAPESSVSTESSASSSDGLYVFFNSGDKSGASQPHRHMQLLPVNRMREGMDDESARSWSVLADQLAEETEVGLESRLPFMVFKKKISSHLSAEQLHAAYLELYNRACEVVDASQGHTTKTVASVGPQTSGEARISYNLAMTQSSLVVCPRLADGVDIIASDRSSDVGDPIGHISLNGTLLAGTVLVKMEKEWDAMRADKGALGRSLAGIGVPTI